MVRLERRLAHAPEKVWRAVTEPAEMAHWFPARVETEPKVGAAMRFTFEGADDTTEGEIIEFDPPKVFAFRWNGDVLRLEIVPDGPGCRLLFSHVLSEETGGALSAGRNAAGWVQCLRALTARLDGGPHEAPPEDMFDRIADYVDRFGLAEGTVLDHPEGHLVRFERDLVWRPAAHVWAALTGRAAGATDQDTAEAARDDLAVGAPPPPAATNGHVLAGPITEVDPPNVLEYIWLHDGAPAGRVRCEVLTDPRSGHRIVITQTVPSGLADVLPTALAAWQTYLEALFATLFGSSRSRPAERTGELETMYADRLG
ncbi:SRPBCC domain-containing protein [Actinomadura alba]|uniref:SRPBCC domain-containing protein n=1 Tax=Actinomadura alba TaxID=406431 RepID=A0ABR7M224_9ACTN|nr:SRPBCC domain-containing protein [Actinomadura alba]